MSIQLKNPWGQTSDNNSQRTDLFMVDLGPVAYTMSNLSYINKFPNYTLLPNYNAGYFYATSITMPLRKVDLVKVTRGDNPRNLPGYQSPVEDLKVEFLVDQEASLNASRLVAMLNIWRLLTRMGRTNEFGGPQVLLQSADQQPQYRYDVPVYAFEGVVNNGDYLNNPQVVSQQWTLCNCWPIDHSVSQLSADKADMLKITVNFAASCIDYQGGTGHIAELYQAPKAVTSGDLLNGVTTGGVLGNLNFASNIA